MITSAPLTEADRLCPTFSTAPIFWALRVTSGECIVPERGDLILVICQRQPDRGADLSQSDNANFDSHGFLFSILIICRLQGSQQAFGVQIRIRHRCSHGDGGSVPRSGDWRPPGMPGPRPTRHAVPATTNGRRSPRGVPAAQRSCGAPGRRRFPNTIITRSRMDKGYRIFPTSCRRAAASRSGSVCPAAFQVFEYLVSMGLFRRLHPAEED